MKCSSVSKENEESEKQAQRLFSHQEAELDVRTHGEKPLSTRHPETEILYSLIQSFRSQ